VAVHDVAYLVIDGPCRSWPAHTKVDKAAFKHCKDADWPCGLDLGAKQAAQQPQTRAIEIGNPSGCGGDVTFEVIGHLAFQDNVPLHVESHTRANTEHVGMRSLNSTQPVVVEEDAEVPVIVGVIFLG